MFGVKAYWILKITIRTAIPYFIMVAALHESPPCTSPAAEGSLRLGSILAVGPSPYRSRTGLRAPNVPWNEHMCPGQWLVSRLPSLAPWPYYGLLCDRPDNIFLTEHNRKELQNWRDFCREKKWAESPSPFCKGKRKEQK